jgi:hypothetical protein
MPVAALPRPSSSPSHRRGSWRLPAICALAIPLAACGGGGGGPEPAAPPPVVASTISEANAVAVAADAYAISSSVYGLSELSIGGLVGASVRAAPRAPDVIPFSYRQVQRLAGVPLPGADGLAGAVVTESTACPGGGSVTITVNDADDDRQLSSGDGASFRFDGCREDGLVIDGTFALGDVVISGPAASPTGIAGTFTYSNMRVTEGGFWTSLNGSARLATTVVNASPLVLSVRIDIPSLAYGASDGSSYTLSDFRATTSADAATNGYTLSVSGTTTDATLGTLTLSTTTPFAGTIGLAPASGRMEVRATDGSNLRLTAIDATDVRIELDANGDGRHESSTSRTWASLQGA